jgi:hypothetical protein
MRRMGADWGKGREEREREGVMALSLLLKHGAAVEGGRLERSRSCGSLGWGGRGEGDDLREARDSEKVSHLLNRD